MRERLQLPRASQSGSLQRLVPQAPQSIPAHHSLLQTTGEIAGAAEEPPLLAAARDSRMLGAAAERESRMLGAAGAMEVSVHAAAAEKKAA